ncbi:Hpt domain-containing protein [uncultured Piscinibacter sp.]|uniref:Hpt domain-containing protein n=1 Tax=uncultured Piscinibacter sp. TaxID=1131835 RepID=UPI00260EC35B|nr:Hpt domain-containing protein [uncultured Piscinibacter sp.]
MSDPCIDVAVFSELQAQAGADFVAELVATFADEGADLLVALRSAAAQGEATSFRRAAHSIKSNAIAFGARALAEQARALELGGLPNDSAGIDVLSTLFESTIAALRQRAAG